MFSAKLDFRPGGIFLYGLKAGNGLEMWGRLTYQEIVPLKKIVFILSFSDENGGITRHPLSNEPWPMEMWNTILFSEKDGKTNVTIKSYPINATDEECKVFESHFGSMDHGYGGTFDRMEEYIATL